MAPQTRTFAHSCTRALYTISSMLATIPCTLHPACTRPAPYTRLQSTHMHPMHAQIGPQTTRCVRSSIAIRVYTHITLTTEFAPHKHTHALARSRAQRCTCSNVALSNPPVMQSPHKPHTHHHAHTARQHACTHIHFYTDYSNVVPERRINILDCRRHPHRR
jgi:hypothetical protein